MANILVTGAARGIGLEFVRQGLARGDTVAALARRPSPELEALARDAEASLLVLATDVTDPAAVRAAQEAVAARMDGLDLLVNNAGLYSTHSAVWNGEATSLDTLTVEEFETVYRINTIAPVLMLQAFRPLLRRSRHPRVLNLSSLLGSITHHTGPGDHAYASSKAALNMLTRLLAPEVRADGIIVLAISPGWVRTDMGGHNASLSTAESVASLLRVAERLTLADSGRFVDHEGAPIAW